MPGASEPTILPPIPRVPARYPAHRPDHPLPIRYLATPQYPCVAPQPMPQTSPFPAPKSVSILRPISANSVIAMHAVGVRIISFIKRLRQFRQDILDLTNRAIGIKPMCIDANNAADFFSPLAALNNVLFNLIIELSTSFRRYPSQSVPHATVAMPQPPRQYDQPHPANHPPHRPHPAQHWLNQPAPHHHVKCSKQTYFLRNTAKRRPHITHAVGKRCQLLAHRPQISTDRHLSATHFWQYRTQNRRHFVRCGNHREVLYPYPYAFAMHLVLMRLA